MRDDRLAVATKQKIAEAECSSVGKFSGFRRVDVRVGLDWLVRKAVFCKPRFTSQNLVTQNLQRLHPGEDSKENPLAASCMAIQQACNRCDPAKSRINGTGHPGFSG